MIPLYNMCFTYLVSDLNNNAFVYLLLQLTIYCVHVQLLISLEANLPSFTYKYVNMDSPENCLCGRYETLFL